MLILTADDFDTVRQQATRPLLVDFWADWCPPCRMLEPILAKLEAELADQLQVATINSDEHPQISARYRVLGLPTLLLFVDGELRESIKGVRSKRSLRTVLEPHLPASARP